jgi:hypothetical protein
LFSSATPIDLEVDNIPIIGLLPELNIIPGGPKVIRARFGIGIVVPSIFNEELSPVTFLT